MFAAAGSGPPEVLAMLAMLAMLAVLAVLPVLPVERALAWER